MRTLLSTGGGLLAALLLFVLMERLIDSGDGVRRPSTAGGVIDFVRLEPETTVRRRTRVKPPPPPPVVQRPPPPKRALQPVAAPTPLTLPPVAPTLVQPVVAGAGPYLGAPTMPAGTADGDIIPIIRIAPRYPREARLRGTEGWVKVRFTITADGAVEAPSVIESRPRRVFDREALRAISRWRFKPRVVNGVAVTREAEQVIEFTMGGG